MLSLTGTLKCLICLYFRLLLAASLSIRSSNTQPDDTAERATENYYNSVCDGCEECTGDCLLDQNGTQECIAAIEYTKSTGVDQYSGAPITLETLQIKAGYWRSVKKSAIILPCWNEDACIGGLTGAADYCDDGYRGPCEHIIIFDCLFLRKPLRNYCGGDYRIFK